MADTTKTKNGGPKAPKIDRLEELMDYLTQCKQNEREGDGDGSADGETVALRKEFNNTIQEVIDALDWTHTMLSNRSTYMKKQQIKKKLFLSAAKSLLSKEELAELAKQAERNLGEVIANGRR